MSDTSSKGGSSSNIVLSWHSEAWLSIFKNYTIIHSDGIACSNGVISDFNFPDFTSFYLSWNRYPVIYKFQHVIEYVDPLKTLRFVSCYDLKLEPLLFKELVNIYDNGIWICLISAMAATAMAMQRVRQRWSFLKNFVAIFKIVVGQGDPFLHKVLHSIPTRQIAVAFLFMGIILSEGYKSSNMYNIVTPRKVISKQAFAELVRDNFTIFSRSSDVDFSFDHDEIVDPLEDAYDVSDHLISSWTVYARSEVSKMENNESILLAAKLHPMLQNVLKNLVIQNKDWYSYNILRKYIFQEYGNSSDYLATYIKILEGELDLDGLNEPEKSIIIKIQEQWGQRLSENEGAAREHSFELAKLVKNWEDETLFSFLQNCTNAALILPEYLCAEHASRLRVKETQHFSIGIESYPAEAIGVELLGIIPPTIIKRIKGIETSGIWDWHYKFAKYWTALYRINSNTNPVSVTLSGHVLIVFLILPLGFAIASTVVILEFVVIKFIHILSKPIKLKKNYDKLGSIAFVLSLMLSMLTNFVVQKAQLSPYFEHSMYIDKTHMLVHNR